MRKGYVSKHSFNARHGRGAGGAVHRHTFSVNIAIEKTTDNDYDFFEYEKIIRAEIAKYQGKVLNKLEEFADIEPDIENICLVMYRNLKEKFSEQKYFELQYIEVSDSPTRAVSIGEYAHISCVHRVYSEEEFRKKWQQKR